MNGSVVQNSREFRLRGSDFHLFISGAPINCIAVGASRSPWTMSPGRRSGFYRGNPGGNFCNEVLDHLDGCLTGQPSLPWALLSNRQI